MQRGPWHQTWTSMTTTEIESTGFRCHHNVLLKRVVCRDASGFSGRGTLSAFVPSTVTHLNSCQSAMLNLHITRGKHTTFVSLSGDGAAYSLLKRVARVNHHDAESCSVAQAHVICSLTVFTHKFVHCCKHSLSSAHSLLCPCKWLCPYLLAQYCACLDGRQVP